MLNVYLRRVAEAKDTEIAALRAALEAGQARQAELIKRLELRVAELAPPEDGQRELLDAAVEGAAGGEGTPEGGPAGVAAGAVEGAQARRAARPSGLGPGAGAGAGPDRAGGPVG